MTTTNIVPVDSGNSEQLRAWNGDEGAHWATHADHFDRSVAAYHQPFLDAAAIATGDRVLDIGCGTGQTTRDAARAAARGFALGVDLSGAMLAVARRRAAEEGVANARFAQADAQVHPFDPESFDVAISRTGAMFFRDPVAAFANVAGALRPDGRLVLLTWQPLDRNEWVHEFLSTLTAGRDLPAPPPNAPGPFSLADPDRIRAILTAAGYRAITVDGASAPMWFGAGPDDAQELVLGVLGWTLEGLDGAGRARALEALRATITAHTTANGVLYKSATWTVSATRA